ncbi:Transcription elongation factor SPT5 [Manis javanica]|nr:Transcription elongation factor SPT5 [Manis javanica]
MCNMLWEIKCNRENTDFIWERNPVIFVYHYILTISNNACHKTRPPSQLPDSKMAAAFSAHPSYRTSPTPGPPISRSVPSSFGLHPHASGLATRNPAPPEPRLLLVTIL